MSFFDCVERLPPDPILTLPLLFKADSRLQKVNLGIGAYKDEQGKPYILQAVRKAEEILFAQKLDKEYQPIEGSKAFVEGSIKLIYGESFFHDRLGGLQTIGGIGALRLAAEFFVKHGYNDICISTPTWPNHLPTFQKAGMHVSEYPYYDSKTCEVLFDAFCQFLNEAAPQTIILLQACCHNPTGMDLTPDQWKEVSEILLKKKLIPFFDLAYQGLGDSLEGDVWPIRYFASQDHEMFVASSYSKNLGLYGERVGALTWYMKNAEVSSRLLSQFKSIVRGIYSSPPLHGGRIISTILDSSALYEEWVSDLNEMRSRIHKMREQLMNQLDAKSLIKNFTFMKNQKGMFSLSGLQASEVERLQKEFGIYMLSNGRMSIPGLTSQNIAYVASSILTIVNQS